MVDRSDLGVGRRTGSVRREGGVLAKQAWVGRLGWAMLVICRVSLIVAQKYITLVLGSGPHLYDAPRPKDDDACRRRNNDIAPGRGKRLESRWHYRHFVVDCGWSEHE
jgi:hypothetical protein